MVGSHRTRVHWILDADIAGCFDHVSHAWLVRFVAYRIGDKRVVSLIQPWLKAGGLREGSWPQRPEGVPQGGLRSPVLANMYLHDAFDVWAHDWRKRNAQGDVIMGRYADGTPVQACNTSGASPLTPMVHAGVSQEGGFME